MSSAKIHPTAIVDSKAELDSTVEVGPYTVIGAEVNVGPGTRIGAHATLDGPMTLGADNRVFNYAVLGTDSQDMKYGGGRTFLRIGDRNNIREFVTINRATEEGTETVVGNDNQLLAYVHIAHNCRVGDGVIMSNVASLAGHVEIGDCAVLGGLVAVHQFCRIGSFALVGAGAKVVKDIAPYCLADGVPALHVGVNKVRLQRSGFTREQIEAIRHAYTELFRHGRNMRSAADRFAALDTHTPEQTLLLDFIGSSERGVARIRRAGRVRSA